jgi:hypothetical protein
MAAAAGGAGMDGEVDPADQLDREDDAVSPSSQSAWVESITGHAGNS